MGTPSWYWRLVRPDAISVWDNEEVRRRLKWYYEVMVDVKPAKFMIAKRIEVPEDPSKLDLEGLWSLHEEYSKRFWEVFTRIRDDKLRFEELPLPDKWNLLHVKARIAWETIKSCRFCERKCGFNRYERPGACQVDYRVYVHSWFHHLGEESPLVPSGTIFYGGCNFRCIFCQNYDISQVSPKEGVIVDARRLALIQKELRESGARNINHVGGDPTPDLHVILESLLYLNVNVPQLWNSNMYLTVESMKLLRDVIDIWLPDFKYGNNKCAIRLSAAPRYWEIITRNLKMIAEWKDPIIIRHLVLPNHIECCTKPILEWIAENIPHALVNIMEQYRPEHLVAKYPDKWPDIARRPTREEMLEAYKYAEKLGIVYEQVS
ncbi:MAG TPA: radical SAM protein [Desulfurococcaceae archaeon]|nr:radical SAM protein [Desulfurococcaceae archaeon]